MSRDARKPRRQAIVDLVSLPATWAAIALTLFAASLIWAAIDGWSP